MLRKGEFTDPKNLHIAYFNFTEETTEVIDECGNVHTRSKEDFKERVIHYIDPLTIELALQRAEILRNAASKLEEYARSEQSSQNQPKETIPEKEPSIDKEKGKNIIVYTIKLL